MHDEAYISFTVYTGKQEGDFNDGVVSALNHTQFPRDATGRFSIEISPQPKAGALHMQSGKANCVIARHYFERETCAMADPRLLCEIDIECLDEPGFPRPLAPTALADKLRAAMTFIESQTLARKPPNPASAPSWFSMVPNQLPKPEKWVPTEGGGAGAIDNAYCAGLVVLQPDQALVVEARWPKCVYANVMFWNRFQQTGDYRYRSCSLNRKQMKADSDGRFSFVVSPTEPGPEGRELDRHGGPVLRLALLALPVARGRHREAGDAIGPLSELCSGLTHERPGAAAGSRILSRPMG